MKTKLCLDRRGSQRWDRDCAGRRNGGWRWRGVRSSPHRALCPPGSGRGEEVGEDSRRHLSLRLSRSQSMAVSCLDPSVCSVVPHWPLPVRPLFAPTHSWSSPPAANITTGQYHSLINLNDLLAGIWNKIMSLLSK